MSADTSAPLKKGLAHKLLEISRGMDRVPKRGYNSFHKYYYVLESDAIERYREVSSEVGVLTTFACKELLQRDNITTIRVEFTLTDVETGEKLSVDIIGAGQDTGDKGIYKAYTGAYKYFILKTFMVPTGDDPEADEPTKPSPIIPETVNKEKSVRQVAEEVPVTGSRAGDIVRIKEILEKLAPGDLERQGRILYDATTFTSVSGKTYPGVTDPNKISTVVRDGKKMSQSQVVLNALKKL